MVHSGSIFMNGRQASIIRTDTVRRGWGNSLCLILLRLPISSGFFVVLCLRLCPSVNISLMLFYCAMIWSSPSVEYEQRVAEMKIQVYQRIRSSIGNMS